MIKQHPKFSSLFISDCGTKVFADYSIGELKHSKPRVRGLKVQGSMCLQLTNHKDQYGYVIYVLPYQTGLKYFNNRSKKVKAHQLVATTFLKNKQNSLVVHHKDNNPSNNAVTNLEWSSLADNNRHSNTGFNARSKYSVILRKKAITLIKLGVPLLEISQQTGIKMNTLKEAKRKQTWLREWEKFND